MAGTVATIISLEKNLPRSDRAIVKAMTECRVKSDLRIQPIDETYAYLVCANKKKANAESDLMTLLSAYKGFGGVEFDVNILTANSPVPAMAGINNDKVEYIDSPVSIVRLNDPEWCREHGVALPN